MRDYKRGGKLCGYQFLVIKLNMESNPQLSIDLVWEDVDLEELCISAHNGCYCGTAKAYFCPRRCWRLGRVHSRIPQSVSDLALMNPLGSLLHEGIRLGHYLIRVFYCHHRGFESRIRLDPSAHTATLQRNPHCAVGVTLSSTNQLQ
jgi:hypothetical protein